MARDPNLPFTNAARLRLHASHACAIGT
jgi:hypothetical protein